MLEIPASESPSEVFSSHNVTRAWISTKKLHPLLGAKFYERPNAGGVDFVVSEARLNQISSDEIVYTTLQSDDDACALVDEILNGPRNLSNDQLAQLWIISFPGSSSYAFSYSPSTCYQLFLQMAHSIHDAAAQNTVIKTFLDILVHSSTLEKYIPKGTLESRLMLHLAIEDLSPSRKYSSARQRWRLAIAQVIHFRRATTWKVSSRCHVLVYYAQYTPTYSFTVKQGGHTLPRTITPLTPETPPVSRTFRLKFSKSLSERILTGCREAGITFGHALSVLSQLAHARVLHRLYARGALSEAEWNYQIRQPMHQSGPINLRPYLDQEWLSTGGAERVCMAVSFSRRTLPSMPVAREGSRVLENPPFDALLSSARFFHRCRTVKRQTVGLLTHPLQTEFAQIVSPARLEKSQLHALNWRAHIRAAIEGTRACNLSLSTPPPDECVLSIACSTVGDVRISLF